MRRKSKLISVEVKKKQSNIEPLVSRAAEQHTKWQTYINEWGEGLGVTSIPREGTPIYKLYMCCPKEYSFGAVLVWNRVIDFAFLAGIGYDFDREVYTTFIMANSDFCIVAESMDEMIALTRTACQN